MAKDLASTCPCCHVPNNQLDDNEAVFPLRDSKLQTKAVEVHLGLVPNVSVVPTPRSLGIRPVAVSVVFLTQILSNFSTRMRGILSQICITPTGKPHL
jgi:hypothetical protein